MHIYNLKKYKNLRQTLRNKPSKAEIVLWSKLKNQQLNYKFRRQQGIGSYIVDFYCSELNLIIEVDGFTHLSEQQFNQDIIRQKFLENKGHLVKRYSDQQVVNSLEDVIKDLYFTCKQIREKMVLGGSGN